MRADERVRQLQKLVDETHQRSILHLDNMRALLITQHEERQKPLAKCFAEEESALIKEGKVSKRLESKVKRIKEIIATCRTKLGA